MSGKSLPDELAVSPGAALEHVRLARKRGGTLRLIMTAVLLPTTLIALTGVAESVIAVLVALVSGALVARNLKQGLRSQEADNELARATHMPPPLVAMVRNRTLLLGTEGTAEATWCAIPISVKEEQKIRTLALPAARVHRGGD